MLRAIYRAGDQAGLNTKGGKKVGCHDLRHSCAGLLGHADARITLTVYAGLVESQRAELRDDLEAALR